MSKILIIEPDSTQFNRYQFFFEKNFPKAKLFRSEHRESALSFIQQNDIDLLISDINIEGFSLFTILKQNEASSFHTIIITAHIERAYEAFEFNVIDFIQKPFTHDRMLKALNKYDFLMKNKLSPLKQLAIRSNNRIKLINVCDVNYFEGYGPHVKVHKNDGSFELIEKSLEKIDQMIPKTFVRIHRSYIVNSEQIQHIEINNRQCYLGNDFMLPISQSKIKSLKQQMLN